MTDFDLQRQIAQRLKENGFESADFEARQIVQSAMSVPEAEQMLKERLNHHPLQYILGEWEFFGLTFKVGEGVLIPRPDTETVVETAIKLLGDGRAKKILDVCAGSGCIGITLAKKCGADVTLLEKSPDALRYLRENAELNRVDVTVLERDVLQSTDFGTKMPLDLIVSNPPYIRSDVVKELEKEVQFEPKMALDGGEDGLKFYREITKKAKKSLKDGGHLVFEIGFDQKDEVLAILQNEGFHNLDCIKDYGGNYRVVLGKYK